MRRGVQSQFEIRGASSRRGPVGRLLAIAVAVALFGALSAYLGQRGHLGSRLHDRQHDPQQAGVRGFRRLWHRSVDYANATSIRGHWAGRDLAVLRLGRHHRRCRNSGHRVLHRHERQRSWLEHRLQRIGCPTPVFGKCVTFWRGTQGQNTDMGPYRLQWSDNGGLPWDGYYGTLVVQDARSSSGDAQSCRLGGLGDRFANVRVRGITCGRAKAVIQRGRINKDHQWQVNRWSPPRIELTAAITSSASGPTIGSASTSSDAGSGGVPDAGSGASLLLCAKSRSHFRFHALARASGKATQTSPPRPDRLSPARRWRRSHLQRCGPAGLSGVALFSRSLLHDTKTGDRSAAPPHAGTPARDQHAHCPPRRKPNAAAE